MQFINNHYTFVEFIYLLHSDYAHCSLMHVIHMYNELYTHVQCTCVHCTLYAVKW